MHASSTHLTTACLLLAITPILMAGCTPAAAPTPRTSSSSIVTSSDSVTTTVGEADSAHMVSLRVPSMHCTFSCWPKVKKELEQQEGVAEATLAEQASEDELTNPVVLIRTDGPFDSDKAVAALTKIGFADASLEK
jgi:periplasmic mercuric ion binding protein